MIFRHRIGRSDKNAHIAYLGADDDFGERPPTEMGYGPNHRRATRSNVWQIADRSVLAVGNQLKRVDPIRPLRTPANGTLAERVGFEPTVSLHPRRISSAVHSTTLPPLREVIRHGGSPCRSMKAGV